LAGAIRGRVSHGEEQELISADVRSDPRYLTKQETTGAEVVAPIIAGRDLVGTLDFASDRPHAFSDAVCRVAGRFLAPAGNGASRIEMKSTL
jgi:putative methionine-R-sulfoxide reductase with GAF domain